MSNLPFTNQDAEINLAPRSLRQQTASLVRAIEKQLSSGDVAGLRRLSEHGPLPGVFWQLLAQHVLPDGEQAPPDEWLVRWAVLLSMLATLGPLHRPGARLGHALRDASFSELRFTRLMRAEDDALLGEARRVAAFLNSKGQAVDCSNLAFLVLTQNKDAAERLRREFARDFFSTGSQSKE